MTDEQREGLLDRLLENQAHHDLFLRKLEEKLEESRARHEENFAHHEVVLRKLEESYAHHDVFLRKLEENDWDHDAVLRRLEGNLQKLQELQLTDQIAISRLNNQLADFQEQHRAAMLEFDNGLIRLERLIEASVRSRHNGGSQES